MITFTTGQIPTAPQVNANFSEVYTWGADVSANGKNLVGALKVTSTTVQVGARTALRPLHISASGGFTELLIEDPTATDATGRIWGLATNPSHQFVIRAGNAAYSSVTAMVLITSAGVMGLGTVSPTVSGTGLFHHHGDTARIVDSTNVPANSSAAGNVGEYRVGVGFIYFHDGVGWKRTAGSTF